MEASHYLVAGHSQSFLPQRATCGRAHVTLFPHEQLIWDKAIFSKDSVLEIEEAMQVHTDVAQERLAREGSFQLLIKAVAAYGCGWISTT